MSGKERVSGPAAEWEMVGRSAELAALRACAEQARAGKPRCVVVRGGTGSGKTALLDRFRRDGAPDGATVLSTAGHRTTLETPYATVGRLFGDPREAGPPRQERLVPAAPSPGPLVLVVDDAQWCDERSLRWLECLLHRPEGLPLLAVLAWGGPGSGPGGPTGQALGRIVRRPGTRLLSLGPLTEAEVAAAAARCLGRPPGAAAVRRCAELSGGNPLLLRRLLTRLRGSGARPGGCAVGDVDAAWRRSHASLVRAHLRGLSATELLVVRAAAVLGWTGSPAAEAGTGHPASPERVGALAGVPARLVPAVLGGYRDGGLLAAAGPEALRAAVLEAVPAGELARLRTGAARLLNDEGFAAPEVASRLLELPRLDEGWMRGVLRDAAERARRQDDRSLAAPYLRRLLEDEDDEPGRVRTGLELAGALAATDPEAALETLRSLLDRTADARLRASVALQLGMTAQATGRPALAVLSHALDTLRAAPGADGAEADRDLCWRIESAALSAGLQEKPAFAAARQRARAAVAREPAEPAEGGSLLLRAQLGALEGVSAREVVDLAARAMGAEGTAAPDWMRAHAALLFHLADEPGRALETLEPAMADSSGCLPRWWLLADRSRLRHRLGDLPGAVADARAALECAGRPRQSPGFALPLIAWADVQSELGAAGTAEAALARAADSGLGQSVVGWSWYLAGRAGLRLRAGDPDGALAAARRCERWFAEVGMGDPAWTSWRTVAVQALAALGRTAEAVGLAEEGLAAARRWGTPYALGHALLAAGTAARGDRRVELLTAAVETLSRSQARLDRARCELLLGRELSVRGDTRGAVAHLSRAHETARRCGSLLVVAKAREALAAAGADRPRRSAAGAGPLSGTERQVAEAAAAGATNQEIAEALFLSRRTVETHLTAVYRKLGLAGRTDLPAALRALARPAAHAADPAAS
ncbi:LuxR family transcriptional regulator [Kitasatospora brasiliensis]|uniref:LuxR family transcriptional regulator n=1 Tax=Kitasatospora brasiliensis TaxID=3058040 RepID=UPI00292CA90C|nr:LuxR family transcriptional regulator [Kitasatospora sp. K002]